MRERGNENRALKSSLKSVNIITCIFLKIKVFENSSHFLYNFPQKASTFDTYSG